MTALGLAPSYTYRARVSRVVDGDTVDVVVDVGFAITTAQRLRLWGIDTPEHGTPGAAEATARVGELTTGAELVVRTFKAPDLYGRYLALVQLPDGRDLSTVLLDAGLGVPYYGGTKGVTVTRRPLPSLS